jgi:hypothetical protein
MVEGKTETAFRKPLLDFLDTRIKEGRPRIRFIPYHGRIPKEDKLKRIVRNLLAGNGAYGAVIALTDVYTGTDDFTNAADAKTKMSRWVGDIPHFYPHAAQYDFEAWLLPYWPTMQRLAGHNRGAPAGNPESVNHDRPPSKRIIELFQNGTLSRSYSKTRDAAAILRGNDLSVAIEACPELKALVNTILRLSGAEVIP